MLKDLRKRANGRRFPRARLFWVRPGRDNEWWDNFITQRVTAEEWKENFRMNRETFLKLCDDLRPSLEGQATRMQMPLSVEKQVAVTLYYLADEGRMRKVANAFDIGKSTVSKVVRRVTMAISRLLGPQYIKHPQTIEKVKEMATHLQQRHGFPQCIGAIDGTHIGIKKPSEKASDYINRKGSYTMNIQACAYYKYWYFISISMSLLRQPKRPFNLPKAHSLTILADDSLKPKNCSSWPFPPLANSFIKKGSKG